MKSHDYTSYPRLASFSRSSPASRKQATPRSRPAIASRPDQPRLIDPLNSTLTLYVDLHLTSNNPAAPSHDPQPIRGTLKTKVSYNAPRMNEADLHYPPDVCPFCNIAAAFRCPESSLWSSRAENLGRCVPGEEEANYEKTSPSSFVVLRSRDVVAFLDILPMTGGT